MTHDATVTVTDTVEAVTEKAILLRELVRPFNPNQSEWIAKSQIVECDQDVDEIKVGDEITVEIPAWLARQKGLTE